jgi:hypothetical protein
MKRTELLHETQTCLTDRDRVTGRGRQTDIRHARACVGGRVSS